VVEGDGEKGNRKNGGMDKEETAAKKIHDCILTTDYSISSYSSSPIYIPSERATFSSYSKDSKIIL